MPTIMPPMIGPSSRRSAHHFAAASWHALPLLVFAVVALPACDEDASGTAERATPPAQAAAARASSMDPETAAAWLAAGEGRILVDLRVPAAFVAGHAPGAVNLQQDFGQFELRARRFFGADAALLLAAGDSAAARALAEKHAGDFAALHWLDAPVTALRAQMPAWPSQATAQAREAHDWLQSEQALLLDARTAAEYAEGHPRGAVFVYPDDFARQLDWFRRDRRYVVLCEAGWRSSLLVSWMRRAGFQDVRNLLGGMTEWRDEGLPVETGAEQIFYK